MELLPSDPFVLTLPSNATVNSAGEVVCDLTPGGSGAALADLSNVTASVGRAALSVPATAEVDLKADIHLMGPVTVDVDSTGFLAAVRWRPGFAGTIARLTMVISEGPIAGGEAVVTVAIAGADCTTTSPLAAPIASAAGFAVDVAVTAGGAFTADQEISVTPSGTNSATAFAGVGIEYTRT